MGRGSNTCYALVEQDEIDGDCESAYGKARMSMLCSRVWPPSAEFALRRAFSLLSEDRTKFDVDVQIEDVGLQAVQP